VILWGLEWHSLDSYMQFKEQSSAPGTPETNHIRLYAKDNGASVSTLCYKADNGSETCLPTAGSLIPTMATAVANRLAYWATTTQLDDVPRTLTAGSVLFTHSDFLPQEDNTKFFWDNTNKQLLIGINTGSHLGTDSGLLADEDASSSILGSAAHSATVTHAGALNLLRSRGTHASQSIVASGDRISRIVSQAYDGAAYRDAASIDAEVDGTPASGDMPGRLVFNTTLDGTTTLVEAARITNAGLFGLGNTAPVFHLDIRGSSSVLGGMAIERTAASPASYNAYQITGSATANNAFLGFFSGGGSHTGLTADRVATGLFAIYAGEAWTSTAKGSYLTLETTPTGSVTCAERFRAGPAGQWGIGGATFGSSGDIFSSGGASAAPTWVTRATLNAALDHGLLAGLADDDHTQYALLAGRSGGQTLKGGTAAGDDLTLQATTGNGVGSEGIIFLAGNAGATEVARFFKSSASSNYGLGIGTATPDSFLHITGSISNASANANGMHLTPTFTGAGSNPRTATFVGTYTPSASIAGALNFVLASVSNPASGKSITNVSTCYIENDTGSDAGTVGTIDGLTIGAPSYGSIKPTNVNAINIANQGASGVTTAVGINIAAQSGSTNNFDIAFNTVDTTAAGAYYGRVPVFYNGLTKYLHVFSA